MGDTQWGEKEGELVDECRLALKSANCQIGRVTNLGARAVYAQLYIRPTTPGRTRPDLLAQRDLVAALSAANTGQGTWEPGWRIVEVDDDDCVAVIKDTLTFWVPLTGLRTSQEHVVPGQLCRVRVAKELRNLMAVLRRHRRRRYTGRPRRHGAARSHLLALDGRRRNSLHRRGVLHAQHTWHPLPRQGAQRPGRLSASRRRGSLP